MYCVVEHIQSVEGGDDLPKIHGGLTHQATAIHGGMTRQSTLFFGKSSPPLTVLVFYVKYCTDTG